jgi:sialic acid synthase SpsE
MKMSAEFSPVIKIGHQAVGPGSSCYIIAEAGSNHNRDFKMATKLIDAAVEAKADAVKFQTFSAETIASKADIPLTRIDFAGAKSPYELFKKLELPRNWQKDLFDYAAQKRITFLSTPFDEKAVDELFEIGVEAFKIASFEINHFPLLSHVAQTGKPVLLSTGMATLGEIEEALEVLLANGCHSVGLFHCGISYPLNNGDVNLRAMETLAQAFQCPAGYSDHTMGIAIPIAAAARNARMIEKHFTLGRTLPGPDHAFALEPHELSEMVASVRAVEEALGSAQKGPAKSEMEFKARGRRSLFAKTNIPKGTIIQREMIAVLRPGAGLHPRYLDILIGHAAVRDIAIHEPIVWDCF